MCIRLSDNYFEFYLFALKMLHACLLLVIGIIRETCTKNLKGVCCLSLILQVIEFPKLTEISRKGLPKLKHKKTMIKTKRPTLLCAKGEKG